MSARLNRTHLRPVSLAALAVAPLALVAAACGSNAASPSTTASTGATSTTATTAAAKAGAPAVKTATVAKLGTVLVDAKGLTLYTYSPDPQGKSLCTGACATTWPPLTVPSASTPIASGMSGFTVIHRSGGALQVAYHGKPLYSYSGDASAGTANGEGIGGTWFVVKTGAGAAGATTTTSKAGGGGGY